MAKTARSCPPAECPATDCETKTECRARSESAAQSPNHVSYRVTSGPSAGLLTGIIAGVRGRRLRARSFQKLQQAKNDDQHRPGPPESVDARIIDGHQRTQRDQHDRSANGLDNAANVVHPANVAHPVSA